MGGHFGFGSGRASWDSVSAPSPVADYTSGQHITSHRVSGVFGGAHVGLNYQLGSVVLGLEPSYSATTIDGRSNSATGSADDRYTTRINHIFTTTIRTGYATDKWLAYLKLGYASGSVKTRLVDAVGAEQGSGQKTERHHGFLMGPGFEYRLTPNVILGTEYNYLDLGKQNHSVGDLGSGLGPVVNKVDPRGIHQFNLRLSYLFNW
jgi:outer membrane immunogenic protein